MMLRSSSTPVLGSLLPSFSDSPNNNNNCHLLSEFTHKSTSKISCNNNNNTSLFHSPSANGFRRVQSEGNLGELAEAVDEFNSTLSKKKHPARLEAIPSFSNHRSSDTDDDDSDYEECKEENQGPDQFKLENLVLKDGGGRMYLAAGLGLSGGGNGSGGRGSYRPVAYDRDEGGGGRLTMEEHYRKMVEGDPGNPMVLRNYAQFLHQVKGDLQGAEEYYSRAILADPKDGEILSQYGKLVWEVHHDENRAAHYFERAIQASGQDSHVHAAYASFLWDTEEEEEEENTVAAVPVFRHGWMASATA